MSRCIREGVRGALEYRDREAVDRGKDGSGYRDGAHLGETESNCFGY